MSWGYIRRGNERWAYFESVAVSPNTNISVAMPISEVFRPTSFTVGTKFSENLVIHQIYLDDAKFLGMECSSKNFEGPNAFDFPTVKRSIRVEVRNTGNVSQIFDGVFKGVKAT